MVAALTNNYYVLFNQRIVESTEGGNRGILGEVWPAARDDIFSFILTFLLLTSLRASMAKLDWCLTSLSTPLQISIYGREFG